MSQTVSLLSGTKFRQGVNRFQLAGTSSVTFPDANDLDTVAEILASMNSRETENGLETTQNLVLNAAAVNRQVIASGIPGIVDGNAVNVTYGPKGQRINTDVGVPPTFGAASVEEAAENILVVNFAANVNSVGNAYATGFTCKVGGVNRVINSAARQADHKIIWFTLASDVANGDVVTFSYDQTVGNLLSDTGAAVQSTTDHATTNNVAA